MCVSFKNRADWFKHIKSFLCPFLLECNEKIMLTYPRNNCKKYDSRLKTFKKMFLNQEHGNISPIHCEYPSGEILHYKGFCFPKHPIIFFVFRFDKETIFSNISYRNLWSLEN